MFDLAETLWVRVRLPLSSNFGHRVHQGWWRATSSITKLIAFMGTNSVKPTRTNLA